MEEGIVADFLRASGHAEAVETVQLLLFTATIRLTQDLRDLCAVATGPITRRAICHELVKVIGRQIRFCSAEHGNAFSSLMKAEACVCGSMAAETDLDDAAVDIVITHDVSSTSPSGDTMNPFSQQPPMHEYCVLEIFPGDVTIRMESHSPIVPLLNDEKLREDMRAVIESKMTLSLHHHLLRPIELKIWMNQQNAVDAAVMLRGYLESNPAARPVIIFLKVVVKQFNVHSSQLTSYVLTLMVVAFARYHARAFPSPARAHYPRWQGSVESGRLLLAFLSFFSPLPKGKFDARRMYLAPAHPNGIFFVEDAPCSSPSCRGGDPKREEEYPWSVLEPTVNASNAAAECTSIHECRPLFEQILRRLLNNYTGWFRLFPDVNSNDETGLSRTQGMHLIPLLLGDWWADRRKGPI